VNWRIAGNGITHSERLEHARIHGAHMHGIQTWVALPNDDEEIDPGFWHHPADSLPTWTETSLRGRMIAGAAECMDAGAKVNSPLFYMHWDMDAGASRGVPGEHAERAVYLTEGAIEVAGQALMPGQMAVLGKGDLRVKALAPSTVMVLGGEPVGERFIFWNFVPSSKARLNAAKEDWKQGRMKLPDGDVRSSRRCRRGDVGRVSTPVGLAQTGTIADKERPMLKCFLATAALLGMCAPSFAQGDKIWL
jgi:redox-sensitive bicupin YhaK (pirin superfamily)